jgi:hypothetical protein
MYLEDILRYLSKRRDKYQDTLAIYTQQRVSSDSTSASLFFSAGQAPALRSYLCRHKYDQEEKPNIKAETSTIEGKQKTLS